MEGIEEDVMGKGQKVEGVNGLRLMCKIGFRGNTI